MAGMASPVVTQVAYRGRNDDGTLHTGEGSATWKDTQNTPWEQAPDENFRVRFEVQESGGADAPRFGAGTGQPGTLQYRHKPAAGSFGDWTWVQATGTGAQTGHVRSAGSSHVADNSITFDILTAGTGTFMNGFFDDVDTRMSTVSIPANGHTEIEFCLTLDSSQVGHGDEIELRATSNSDLLDGYNVVAHITVVAEAGPVEGGPLAYSGAGAFLVTDALQEAEGGPAAFSGVGDFSVASASVVVTGDPLAYAGVGRFVIDASEALVTGGPLAFSGQGALDITAALQEATGGPLEYSGQGVLTVASALHEAIGGPLVYQGQGIFTVISSEVIEPGGEGELVIGGPLDFAGMGVLQIASSLQEATAGPISYAGQGIFDVTDSQAVRIAGPLAFASRGAIDITAVEHEAIAGPLLFSGQGVVEVANALQEAEGGPLSYQGQGVVLVISSVVQGPSGVWVVWAVPTKAWDKITKDPADWSVSPEESKDWADSTKEPEDWTDEPVPPGGFE